MDNCRKSELVTQRTNCRDNWLKASGIAGADFSPQGWFWILEGTDKNGHMLFSHQLIDRFLF